MSDYETLAVTVENHVASVELARPKKLNAMNRAFWDEMRHFFESVDDRPDIRVVVLSGQGRLFTAGLDLKEFAGLMGGGGEGPSETGRQREHLRRNILLMQNSFSAIENCRVPVIAAIHGACIGGGIDMITACCMRFATNNAYFTIHEINIGMTADVGTLQRLPHVMPAGLVRELAYSGRKLSAAEGIHCGFLNAGFDTKDDMMAHVMTLAAGIASRSPLAIMGTKEILLHTRDHSVADGLKYMAAWNAALIVTDDLGQAIQAQMTKSEATFKDLDAVPRKVSKS